MIAYAVIRKNYFYFNDHQMLPKDALAISMITICSYLQLFSYYNGYLQKDSFLHLAASNFLQLVSFDHVPSLPSFN